jgi:hypothetical protein
MFIRALLALVILTACGTSGFERGAAVTVPHDLHVGGRVWAGMPRGRAAAWVTEFAVVGQADGFFAVAGGIGVRKRRGITPRAGAAFGVGGRRIASDLEGENGISFYGEAQLGVDIPLAPTTYLYFSAIGTLYLNGEQPEPHLMGAVGLLWK